MIRYSFCVFLLLLPSCGRSGHKSSVKCMLHCPSSPLRTYCPSICTVNHTLASSSNVDQHILGAFTRCVRNFFFLLLLLFLATAKAMYQCTPGRRYARRALETKCLLKDYPPRVFHIQVFCSRP